MANEADIVLNHIRDAKSSSDIYELPCGVLVGGELHKKLVVRELSGREEDLLGSRKSDRIDIVEQILEGCIIQIGTLSPEETRKVVPSLLSGDRVYAILAIRRTSLGDLYPFKAKCPVCGKEYQLEVDLGEFEVVPMPEPKTRVYQATTSRGVSYQWSPMDGKREQRVNGMSNSDMFTANLLGRVDLYDGNPTTLSLLKGLSSRERNDMRSEFQKYEGGVKTSVEFTCPNPKCEADSEITVDIAQIAFFIPSAARNT